MMPSWDVDCVGMIDVNMLNIIFMMRASIMFVYGNVYGTRYLMVFTVIISVHLS